jgi:hypothetical protein
MNERQQNTAKNTYAPKPVVSTKGGVINPYRCVNAGLTRMQDCELTITKLLNQFEAVDSATPFPLKLDGKISEGIAHGLDDKSVSTDRP